MSAPGFETEVLRRLDEHAQLINNILGREAAVTTESNVNTLELDLQNKTAKMSGNDIFTMISALGVVGLLVFAWIHHEDAKTGRAEFIAVMKQQVIATNESTKAQRYSNCLWGFPEAERPQRAKFCEELTR